MHACMYVCVYGPWTAAIWIKCEDVPFQASLCLAAIMHACIITHPRSSYLVTTSTYTCIYIHTCIYTKHLPVQPLGYAHTKRIYMYTLIHTSAAHNPSAPSAYKYYIHTYMCSPHPFKPQRIAREGQGWSLEEPLAGVYVSYVFSTWHDKIQTYQKEHPVWGGIRLIFDANISHAFHIHKEKFIYIGSGQVWARRTGSSFGLGESRLTRR
jgi:hypothetical protein